MAPLFLLLVLLMPTEARPCSPPGCSVPLRRPAGERYPANSPGIPLRFFALPQSASAQLYNLDTGAEVPGEAVQSTFAWRGYGLFVPQQPLAPGRYALEGEVQCPSSAEIWRYRVPLELEASAPLPTQLGTVEVRSFGVLPEGPESGAACISPPMGATALLEVTPAPELLPWLAATGWALEIDGQLHTVTQPGIALWPDGGACSGVHPLQLLSARCAPDAGSVLSPEIHQGRLHALIAGVDGGPAPVAFSIDLRCDAGTATSTPPTECEAWLASVKPDPVVYPDGGPAVTLPAAESCGCSAAPLGGAWVGLWALVAFSGRRAATIGRAFDERGVCSGR